MRLVVMPLLSSSPARSESDRPVIRVAAAGDIHCHPQNADQVRAAFTEIDGSVDLILLAGDLTTHGEASQARLLADIVRGVSTPIAAVMGNHDWHVNQRDEFVGRMSEAGVTMLDPGSATFCLHGIEVGIAGAKGFIGGFPGCHLPDFGEPSLRGVYAETGREVQALDAALREVALCPLRIALMHYSPCVDTLEGEPREIWAFLGCDRLAPPLIEHQPDLVLHGHAHAGRFEGRIGDVPVHNVAVHVMGRPWWVFELTPAARAGTAIR